MCMYREYIYKYTDINIRSTDQPNAHAQYPLPENSTDKRDEHRLLSSILFSSTFTPSLQPPNTNTFGKLALKIINAVSIEK